MHKRRVIVELAELLKLMVQFANPATD